MNRESAGWYFRSVQIVKVFYILIPAYDAASFRWCVEVLNYTIEKALAIYIALLEYFHLVVMQVISVVTVNIETPFRGRIGVCRAGSLIGADGILDSVLYDVNNLRSDTYN